ncbi:MAG: hypothetical protein ACI4QT_11030 [Kiritimatiellia bacterium]
MCRHWVTGWAGILLILCAGIVQADVYLQTKRIRATDVPEAAQSVYTRRVELNGVPGELRLYVEKDKRPVGSAAPLAQMTPTIRQNELPGGGSVWQMRIPSAESTFFLVFETDADMRTGSVVWPFDGIAAPDGIRPSFSLSSQDGSLTAAVGEAGSVEPVRLQRDLNGRLASAGFLLSTPDPETGAGCLARNRQGVIAYAAAFRGVDGGCRWILMTRSIQHDR